MYSNLAKAAEDLAKDTIIIDSYKSFFDGGGFFLTKNSGLSGAIRKPPKFPETTKELLTCWTDKKWFIIGQRKYLLILANLKDNQVNAVNYQKIKDAYNKWKNGYYVVFFGSDAKWTCNLFVGEALFMIRKTCLNTEKKYYSAKEIWRNKPNFTQQTNLKTVARGDIAAFHESHVEIVTQVNQKNNSFCSRGSGRSRRSWFRLTGVDYGTERCDVGRKLDDSTIKFFKI